MVYKPTYNWGVPPCRMGHNFKPPISTSIWNIGDIVGDESSNPDWPSQHPEILKYRQCRCRIWVHLDWPVTGIVGMGVFSPTPKTHRKWSSFTAVFGQRLWWRGKSLRRAASQVPGPESGTRTVPRVSCRCRGFIESQESRWSWIFQHFLFKGH